MYSAVADAGYSSDASEGDSLNNGAGVNLEGGVAAV